MKLAKTTGGSLRCKPIAKVNNDGLLVAIITETNHLIPVIPTEDKYRNDLDIISDYDTISIDKDISQSSDVDIERTEFTNMIHLEGEFYNTFKATIKRLIHDDASRHFLTDIHDITTSDDMSYHDKMKNMNKILRRISIDAVKFAKYDKGLLSNMANVTMCMSSNQCELSENCDVSDGRCLMLIPDKNLVNHKKNKELYHDRLSDEIIRYMDVRNYILNVEKIIAPQNIRYKLNTNEILVYQSSLTKTYFDGLVESNVNPYINNSTWETSSPQITPVYDNKINLIYKKSTNCSNSTLSQDINTKLSKLIPRKSGFIEMSFDKKPECSFEILTFIGGQYEHTKHLSVYDIKDILIKEYMRYYVKYKYVILGLLDENGKQLYSKQLVRGEITFSDLIMRDDYVLTQLDIWLFSDKFGIPIVIVWDGTFVETTTNIIITNNNTSGEYFFIRMKGEINSYKSYKLIVHKSGKTEKYLINKKSVTPYLHELINKESTSYTLQTIMRDFDRTDGTKLKKKNILEHKNMKIKTLRKLIIK